MRKSTTNPCRLFLMALLVLLGSSAIAQSVIIGSGTSTQRQPLAYYYGYARSAMIYTAAEMGTTVNGFDITQIGFYCNIAANTGPTIVYLKMVGTNTTQTADTWANKISGATTVFSGTPSNVSGWRMITLSTPFTLSPNQNLEVLVECNYGGGGTGLSDGNQIRYTSVTNTHQYWQQDNSPPTGNGIVSSFRPNIQIVYTTGACSGQPTPGNTLASANPVCASTSFSLTLQNSTPGSGVNYQWQSSPDGSTWTNVGPNSSSYTTSITSPTY